MPRILAFLAAVAMSALALSSGAAAQTIDDIIKRGKIVIAVDVNNPPYGFLDGNQKEDGFDVRVAKLLAAKLGVTPEFVHTTGPNRIPFLLSNRVDVIVSQLSITTERAKQVMYSTPYAPTWLTVIAPKARKLEGPADLAGLRISVPRGSPQDIILTRTVPSSTTIMRFDDDTSAQQALVTGQSDAMGAGALVPQVLNRMKPGQDYENKYKLQTFYFGIGVRKGADDLLRWINIFVFTAREEGALEQIHREALGLPMGPLPTF
ncbi:MAG: transporter substrate-binding domain-containing protein [Alphaproteobacteria bacterium]|nr:transporter substrate-binding domain-containing protein [Alphaproteobacteria bacterium]